MRHRLIVWTVFATAFAGMGCGDDEPPRRQGVFWLGLSTTQDATCSSIRNFELPQGASMTLNSTDGRGERLVDEGANALDCSVRGAAAGSYDLSATLSTGGEIGFFSITGTANDTSAELDVTLQTPSFALTQDGCTATVETVIPGAIWLRDLNCPALRDERSVGVVCAGRGGMIFENCGR